MINISFASVLIVRWEQLLQNVSETVHNATGLYFCYQIYLKSYLLLLSNLPITPAAFYMIKQTLQCTLVYVTR